MPNDLAQRMLETIERHGMTTKGGRVLVAVSGGPDSMALLHLLHGLRDELGIGLCAAHFDHGLRPESAADAVFVKRAAEGLGLEFITERAELSERPGNVQSVARDARYGFLERAAQDLGCASVATGHTMNDQAETYLIREMRGSGASGLKGIPPVRGIFIRPLMDVTREEILAYLDGRGIVYLTDPTNLKPVYLRNRVRMELLPQIEEINPNAVETLARAADIARIEDEYMDTESGAAFEESARETSEKSISLDAASLVSLHPAIRRRVIRRAVEYVKGDLLGITYAHTIDAERLIMDGVTGRGLDLPGRVRVESSYDRVVFSIPRVPAPYSIELNVPGRTEIPEAGVIILAEYGPGVAPGPMEAVIDPEKLTGPLTARSRRPGDRFRPAGMGGSVSLKEYFINIKLPREKRAAAPIIVSGGDIVWVAGHRPDGRFVADGSTKNPLRLFCEP